MFDWIKKVGRRNGRSVAKSVVGPRSWGSYYYPRDKELDYEELVRHNESWVYTCADRNSTAVPAYPLRLYVKTAPTDRSPRVPTRSVEPYTYKRLSDMGRITKGVKLNEVTDHLFLSLIGNPNPFTIQWQLLYQTNNMMELMGDTFWWIVKDEVLDVPQEIWILPTQWVTVLPDRTKFIKGYRYGTNETNYQYFDVDEIIHFKFPHPNNLFRGMPPLFAVLEGADLQRAYMEYETAMNENMARPDVGIMLEKRVNEDAKKALLRDYNNSFRGIKNAGKAVVIDGLGQHGKVAPLGFSPREMQNVLGRKMTMEEIAGAFGIPISKLKTESVNRANAEAGNYQWMVDAIRPRHRLIEETINKYLLPMFDSSNRLFCAFDNCVPQDREWEVKEREMNLRMNLTVINEERAKIGLSPVPYGDIPWAQVQVQPLGTPIPERSTGNKQNEQEETE